MTSGRQYRVTKDPEYGYRRLDPLPDQDDIAKFYERQYYDLVRKGGRAPELHRLMAGGEEAERERAWLRATLYSDVCHVLDRYAPGRRVLDIGCGTGELLSFLEENGFHATGIEPSPQAVAATYERDRPRSLTVYNCTLEEFVEHRELDKIGAFDAVTLLNVLEHVLKPSDMVENAKKLLNSGGLLCVRVPNDFNELQSAAIQKLKKEPWWIAVPDHINYFDFESLHSFLEHLGFEIIHSQGDFPMELFLLMGDDYVGNPEVGGRCHKKRIGFELAVPQELRRRIYQALAKVAVGRDCLVFGRLKT
jgi:2-polyprenyl-3-methyl-5-hydroxy-6-metoxy-1,4-benzoquinol methylase